MKSAGYYARRLATRRGRPQRVCSSSGAVRAGGVVELIVLTRPHHPLVGTHNAGSVSSPMIPRLLPPAAGAADHFGGGRRPRSSRRAAVVSVDRREQLPLSTAASKRFGTRRQHRSYRSPHSNRLAEKLWQVSDGARSVCEAKHGLLLRFPLAYGITFFPTNRVDHGSSTLFVVSTMRDETDPQVRGLSVSHSSRRLVLVCLSTIKRISARTSTS